MNMKQKYLSLLAAAVMGFSGAAYAQPFDQYVTIQGAIADVDGYDSGVAAVLTYGLQVPEMHRNFSVEGEFTTTVAEPDATVSGTTAEVSYFTLAAYGVYSHPLNERLQLRGRLGVLYEDLEFSTPVSTRTDDDFGLSFGVGLAVGLGDNSRFLVDYTVIESDIYHISAGVQFRL